MKRIIPILCFALLFSGCGKNEDNSVQGETCFIEGRFLQSNTEIPLIIIDSGPCTMSSDSEDMFADFTDGDLIEIEFDGDIAETYPAQIGNVYSARLKAEGEISDIDQNIMETLKEMGWVQ